MPLTAWLLEPKWQSKVPTATAWGLSALRAPLAQASQMHTIEPTDSKQQQTAARRSKAAVGSGNQQKEKCSDAREAALR